MTTIKEFSAIMDKRNISTLMLPTISEELANLAYDLLGISLVAAQKWYILNKLNIHMVFAYLSWLVIPVASKARSHYLNAFYLCLLARYFLVHGTYRVDQMMHLMVNNLNKGTSVSMILAETLNGLDTVHREEATFFASSPLPL